MNLIVGLDDFKNNCSKCSKFNLIKSRKYDN